MSTQDFTADECTAMEQVRGLIRFLGDDPAREGLVDTPARVIGAMRDFFSGYQEDPESFLAKTFEDAGGYDQLVLMTDIEIYSHCEHHMVPFVGRCHVAYIPKGRVVGLSKIARVVDAYAKRLQIQEKLTVQIASAIWKALQPQGVAVIVEAQHYCMCYRGVKKPGAITTTSKLYGAFMDDPASRQELFTLLNSERRGFANG